MAIFDGVFVDLAAEAAPLPVTTSAGGGIFDGIFQDIEEFLPSFGAAITSSLVQNKGGELITVTALIPAGTYVVHIGPLGTVGDPKVYNGIPGSGGQNVVFAQDGANATASFWIPPLPVGGPYGATLVGVGVVNQVIDPFLTVQAQTFLNRAYSLRRIFPPHWKTGPRSLRNQRFPQT